MLSIPENFTAFTIARAGDAGRNWLERLPDLFESCCRQWGLEIDGAPMHGGLSLVVPVRQDNERFVLKVGWIDESTEHEALALSTWNGQGAARLLASQPEWGAMLLERLDSRRSLNDVDLEPAVITAGQLLRRLAIPSPQGVPMLKEVARRLAETFTDRCKQAGRPILQGRLDRARGLATELGPSAGDLLVNYDLHYADILAGKREPWLAVDPKVVAGDPEYGVAQLLWRRLEEMEAQEGLEHHFRMLMDAAGLDPALSRAWTFVRCVDYWLWGVSVGLTEDPARCAAIIDWLT